MRKSSNVFDAPQASGSRGFFYASGHGVFLLSAAAASLKDVRPGKYIKVWASLLFILTGRLYSSARFCIAQNKEAFKEAAAALSKKTSERKKRAKFSRWENFASSRPTGLGSVKIFALISFLLVSVQFSCPFTSFADEFDYSIYDVLLRKYVADGKVDYLGWKKNDFEVFEKYIASLKDVSVENMERDEQKAFWINAYNALTIYGVLKRIPDRGLLAKFFSVMMVPGFFDTIPYDVAGGSLTLDDIEHKKLRARFNDPRIHFTIVCASRSCPEIQGTVFETKGLDARLDRYAGAFIQDTTRNRLDKKKGTLHLSEIFNWFADDFIGEAGSVINFLKRYLSDEDAQYLSSHEVKIKYLFYDWLVNIKR